MLPIQADAGLKTNATLAGDTRRLGPAINSPLAASLGLKLSYLDRIAQCNICALGSGKGTA